MPTDGKSVVPQFLAVTKHSALFDVGRRGRIGDRQDARPSLRRRLQIDGAGATVYGGKKGIGRCNAFLLHVRNEHLGSQSGLPGGGIRRNIDDRDAAVRIEIVQMR